MLEDDASLDIRSPPSLDDLASRFLIGPKDWPAGSICFGKRQV